MPAATCLEHLLKVRHANRDYIDGLNGHLGSALGFKRYTGQSVSDEPAILIFVPRKVDPKWLDSSQLIRKELKGPGGLTCPTDVVEGGRSEDVQLWAHDEELGEDYLLPSGALAASAPLSKAKLDLREKLRGWTKKVMPGAQLAGIDADGADYHGTLGCFARDADGWFGFITNHHVAGHRRNKLYFPEVGARLVGRVARLYESISDQQRFAGIVDEPRATYTLDCAFAHVAPELSDDDIEVRLPTLTAAGNVKYRRIGEPLPLDLRTMGPLGTEVVGVGRTRSFQRGTISAFAYEWDDDGRRKSYTDYLIIGEDGDEFSDPGDSGKLIVTREGLRPVALLWGGWRERLRAGHGQENWTYAIDIHTVLAKLDAEIVTEL